MKIDALAKRLEPYIPLLRCPACGDGLALRGFSVVCGEGHCYDLSSKGYINLAPSHDQRAEKYDAALFESRSAVFADGFYRPVLDAVAEMLSARFGDRPFALADAGCGEGYYARGLAGRFPAARVIGADISRDAIVAAARLSHAPCWLVADLKRLPVVSGALDAVLDVLTPADYTEFARVLKPDGELIKVIPGADYLCEVRKAVRDELKSEGFDNARVLEHLERHARVLERVELRHTYALTDAQSARFLRMTPMTFSIPEERLQGKVVDHITIHLLALRCRIDPAAQ